MSDWNDERDRRGNELGERVERRAMGYGERLERRPYWTLGKSLVAIFLFVIVVGGVFGAISLITKPARTAAGVINRTLDPDNVIYNYEWFFQQCNAIEAIDVQIANTAQMRDETIAMAANPPTFPQQQEISRLGGVLLGYQNQKQNLIADYDARARMMNRRIFNDVGTLTDCQAQVAQ